MADSGTTLGADLGDLYNAGQYGLPNAAAELTKAANLIPDPDTAWFDRMGAVGLAWFGPWSEMESYASALVEMLRTSATNLNETGDTLVYIANHYAAADDAAITTFNQRKKELVDTPTLQMGYQPKGH